MRVRIKLNLLQKGSVSGIPRAPQKLVKPGWSGGQNKILFRSGDLVILQTRDGHVLASAQIENLFPVLLERRREHSVVSRVEIGLENQSSSRSHQDRAGRRFGLVDVGPADGRDQVSANLGRHFRLLALARKVQQIWEHTLVWK